MGFTVKELHIYGDRKQAAAARGMARRYQNSLEKGEKSATIKSRGFNTTDDPLREVLGCGIDSHPNEIKAITEDLNSSGVEIKYRENSMAYLQGLRPGMPGQFIIDQNASFGAWVHEYKHFCDDRSDGYASLRIFQDLAKCKKREIDAYNLEIQLANDAKRPDIAERLKELMEREVSRYE